MLTFTESSLVLRSTGFGRAQDRSEEHTSELQSLRQLVCRLLVEKKNALRREQRFPLRLMVPVFEAIFHTKYFRLMTVVYRFYMNYNDYGHTEQEPNIAAEEYHRG